MGTRKLLSQTVDVVEVAVRLVLVLLVEFGMVEAVVVKTGCTGWSWWSAMLQRCRLFDLGGARGGRASMVRVAC